MCIIQEIYQLTKMRNAERGSTVVLLARTTESAGQTMFVVTFYQRFDFNPAHF